MMGETKTVELVTGTLDLEVAKGPPIDEMCDFAARANPKRGFLIVSKVLGRHMPARPKQMRATMRQLAEGISQQLPEPILFLGMAETATALGQGLFSAYQQMTGQSLVYLQTSRQRMPGASVLTSFEEGHSHATSHMVQIARPNLETTIAKARSLVIVDDESSTGNTFLAAAEAMVAVMPALETIETVCITDWSDGAYLASMPKPARAVSLLAGRMKWTKGAEHKAAPLPSGSNEAGAAPASAMKSRGGITMTDIATRPFASARKGERVLVLGDGEHSYEALRIAEDIERQGGIAAVQCITRSPALLGHAMQSVSHFDDAYGSGAPCYLYNILSHQPERIIIASEKLGNQRMKALEALQELGADIPVELYECRYEGGN
ncbi:phosphoribosyltransferase domain-containing protein [Croceicoccus hydrothermalis]|uniref:phosphoribosyltransferase domain-containing protein n=1 Tax=Croceicoccus hydrothermalis TaxID=2867964 RepID=UPI001EFB8981|nr:phosphoribosyltransferase domain-containing protein [Croceicoccus hydrothermalis]